LGKGRKPLEIVGIIPRTPTVLKKGRFLKKEIKNFWEEGLFGRRKRFGWGKIKAPPKE